MGRHKDYNRNEVLERAVTVFWQNGFKASSMAEVVKVTGLNSASLYKEFGDKDGLFEEALDHYREQKISPRLKLLLDEPNLKGVEAFLQAVVNSVTSDNYKGCLMMNHIAQKNTISPRAAEKIGAFIDLTEELLTTAIDNARTNGEISADKDPAVLASYIMCSVHGLILYGRHPNKQNNIHKLHHIIWQALGT